MSEISETLVDIPEYAKINKKGQYYAPKKDMPYFQNEKDVRGYIVIGEPSDISGKMIPNYSYFWYCTPEAVAKKEEEEKRRMEAKEEARRKEEEEKAELERSLGVRYIPLDQTWYDLSCYPVNGFLAEKFFRESGLTEILEQILDPERAFLVKLSAALLATGCHTHLEFSLLNSYPMERHMIFEMDRFFSMKLWCSIQEEEMQQILEAWIQKINPSRVSSLVTDTAVTLYHDQWSDQYGGWFISRIRTGTKYYHSIQIYRDEDSGKLLAFEPLQYFHDLKYDRERLEEIHTIRNSIYPELRNASLHYFLPAYTYRLGIAAKQIPVMACMHVSEYEDQKEIGKKLKELEAIPEISGCRIIRWEGKLRGNAGNWVLIENVEQRKWKVEDARSYLNRYKELLQNMSYYPALDIPMAYYYEIEKEDDETDFFDNAPFTVRFVKGATEKFRKDAGRFLYFSTEDDLPDQQLIHRVWCEEDLWFQYHAFINQSETTDITEEYFDGLAGRELPLFLASMYREWLYDHLKDEITEEWEIGHFARDMKKWTCEIDHSGQITCDPMNKKMRELLALFEVTQKDIRDYVARIVQQEKYFSDEYKQ